MSNTNLTAQRLRELLHYDPETGVFTRLEDARRWKRGQVVGSCNKVVGYIYITVNGHASTGHRLAWLYTTGQWPVGVIDHINGNRADNRIANLRDVPHRLNMENRQSAQANNKLNTLGVSMRRGRFRATIKTGGQQIHIGDFDTLEQASAAYIAERRRIHVGNML